MKNGDLQNAWTIQKSLVLYSYKNLYINSKIYIFQNCQMETAKEGNFLHSMLTLSLNMWVGELAWF